MLETATAISNQALIQTAHSLKAIAHPVRLAIVELISQKKSLSVTEIYETLGLEQAVASQHLSVLRQRNILSPTRKGKNTYYSLKHACITEVIELMLSTIKTDG